MKKRTFPLHFQKIYLPLQPQNKEGALAQVVEHRTENPCVPGSSPGGTTKSKEWSLTVPFFISQPLTADGQPLTAYRSQTTVNRLPLTVNDLPTFDY